MSTCLFSAALLRLRLGDHPRRVSATGGTVRATWRVNGLLLRDRHVRGLLLAQWLPPALMVGAEGVLVPYAADIDRPTTAGLLLMAVAAGMFVGDLLIGRLVSPMRRERLTAPLALLLGVPLLGFAAAPGPATATALLAASGFGISYHLGLARRFLEAVPEASRARRSGWPPRAR